MSKHTLFICKSCRCSSEERSNDQPADGTRLLEQLNTLASEQFQSEDFVIQPVACLWTCGQPCAVAFSAPHKPTYLFTNLSTNEATFALLQFARLYLSRKTGNVPWKQFPEALRSVGVAKIPVVKEER
jgi:predicted metal-binding protein